MPTVKEGGADPANNSKLRDVIAKAKANNMPNDTIDRGIKKAAGDLNSVNYENLTYEGYGPSGIAIIVETLTDNKNRTAANVRSAFTKGGGNVGAQEEEDSYEVLTDPDAFSEVREALEKAGIPMMQADVTMIPQTWVELSDDDAIKKMNRILDLLDEDDDVQAVYHNWDE